MQTEGYLKDAKIQINGNNFYLQTSLPKDNELKARLIDLLKKFYDLGVVFQNNFTDEYYNNFDLIKDYILNYGG